MRSDWLMPICNGKERIKDKTGKKAHFGSKTTIIEAYKKSNLKNNLLVDDDLIMKVDKNNILKFY